MYIMRHLAFDWRVDLGWVPDSKLVSDVLLKNGNGKQSHVSTNMLLIAQRLKCNTGMYTDERGAKTITCEHQHDADS